MAYISVAALREALNPTGDPTAHTAASLSDQHLNRVITDAQTEIDARLATRYDVPFDDPVPSLIIRIVTDFAAWHATLDWRRTVDLEERDPVALRYTAARALLMAVVDGTATLPGTPEKAVSTAVTAPINLYETALFNLDDFDLSYSYRDYAYEVH